jgi:hypothetical protein
MKKLLLFGSLALSMGVFGQNARGLRPATFSPGISQNGSTSRLAGGYNQVNNLTCTDTLRYVLNKQASLWNGTGAWNSNFATFNCYKADNEAIAQTFHQSGGSVTISKVEFYGNNDATNGTTSVTVQAAVYNVNGSGVPTTMLGSGNLTISSTTAAYQYVTLATPVTVTGDYAIVLTPTNTNGVLEYFVSSPDPGEPMDGENLTHYKSGYYPNSGAAYVTIPALTTGDATNFPSGPYDFEPLLSPIVSYSLTSSMSATPNPVCLGTAVTLNSSAGPAGVLSSPMYTFGAFLTHFGLQPSDSTLAWDMDGTLSNLIWNTNPSYTYATAGTYTATMYVLGGFSHSCLDQAPTTITVQAPPTATFSYANTAYCTGASNPSPTLGTSTAGTFSAMPAGMNFVSASTGVINLATSAAGTYTVTNNVAAGTCPAANASFTVTVNAAPSVTLSGMSPACSNDADITLSGGAPAGGTYSGTGVTGGMFDPSAGTQTITYSYTDANSCSGSATTTATVNTNPAVTFSTPSATCSNNIPFTLTGGAPAGGTYSGTGVTGSDFDPAAGTQTLTYMYTDANGCAGSATAMMTVNTAPTATFSGLPATVCVNAGDITLSGGAPAGGTYTGTGVTAGVFSPSGAGAGTYTLTYTYTDANNCTDSEDATIMVDPCIGLKEVNDAGAVVMYPNPAKSQVTFSLVKNTDKAEVAIYTVEGKLVYQANFNSNKGTIDVNNFARGLYFVHVKADNTTSITKLMVD